VSDDADRARQLEPWRTGAADEKSFGKRNIAAITFCCGASKKPKLKKFGVVPMDEFKAPGLKCTRTENIAQGSIEGKANEASN
jgi:hypothetical protein